jgi:hypothetical protein
MNLLPVITGPMQQGHGVKKKQVHFSHSPGRAPHVLNIVIQPLASDRRSKVQVPVQVQRLVPERTRTEKTTYLTTPDPLPSNLPFIH